MDAELEILVRAVSDEKSADNATKEIVSRVFSKLKDGAIKLPINSKLDKADLKKLDDSMKQARKEVVSRYNKLLKDMDDPKGFDAFSDKAIKDLVELGKAYTTFNSKASGKSKNSLAAISEVKAALGEVFQLYENESRRLNSKIKELNLQNKVTKSLPSTRSKKSVQTSEALDRYYDKQQKYSEQAKGAKKRNELFKELKEVRENQTPKSLGSHVIGGVVTKRTLHETEHFGSYPSPFARQQAQEKAKYLPHELASLKVEKNKQKVEEYIEALRDGRARTKLTIPIDKIDKKNKLHTKFKDISVYNNKPREYTEEENNELKRDVTTNELAKIIGGIEHRRPDATLELFDDYLESAFIFNAAAGKNSWKAMQETLEKTLNRYRGDRGTLGITDGTPKGEFEGHDNAVKAIKLMLDRIGEKAEYSNAEEYRQQRIAMKIDPKGTIKELEDPLGNLVKKLMPPKSDATTEKNSILARDIQNELTKVQNSSREIFSEVSRGRKIKGIQLAYDKVEHARESLADATEAQVDTTHKNISRDVAKAVRKDTETGFNTDASADALIDTSKQILDKLTECFKVLEAKPAQEKKVGTGASEATKKSAEQKKTTKAKKSKAAKKPTETSRTSVVETKSTEEKQRSSIDTFATVETKKKRTATYNYKPISLFANADAMRAAETFAKQVAQASATRTMLQGATRLALPKADGRRRYPSKGLVDETPIKHLPLPVETTGQLLDIGAPRMTRKDPTFTFSQLKELLSEVDYRKTRRENRLARIDPTRSEPSETDSVIFAPEAKPVKKAEPVSNLPALVPGQFVKIIKEAIGLAKTDIIPMVKTSEITASMTEPPQSIWEKFIESLFKITKATEDYSDVITSTAEQQDQLAAERIQKFGLNNGRNPNDTGDIASIKRALELFRTNKRSIEDNPELVQKIRLTDSIKVDTTKVVEKLSTALSGKEMRNAQMGGSIPRQILGAMTGFIGMPSVEKSRAQADGMNQILGNVNKALNAVLNTIQTKETELRGMEKSGQVKFSADGRLVEGSSAAKKTFSDLEESKLVLRSILADMQMVDAVVEQTGGKFSKMVKLLNFTSPVLRENNTIIRNVGSGLDKNGKALKYQSRLAEILNYTFQLMGRSIGQMLKSWLVQLNPITQIKNMFNDFASYNVKWQRTLNVVKYNLRSIILPIMDKIAQLLTNMIGFVDIILQKVQAAFGNKPISLFDQENADKFKKEMEEIQSISAGFDELHDIGSGGDNDANNFFGEIYKPELSQEWIDLANRIGDLFAGIIKGDLGFGEVMKEILGIAIEGITLIGKEIWKALKSSGIAKYIEEQWASILATLAGMFIGWQLLKVAGKLVFNAITSHLTGTALGKSLNTLGTKFTGWISKLFTGKGLIGAIKAGGASLGTVFASAFVAIAASLIGGSMIVDAFGDAADKTSYNIGLDEVGGKDSDKKGIGGQIFQGTAGGAIAGAGIGFALGGPLGAAIGAGIGAIAGALTTALAPAFEEAAVKAKELNNEMQKIEYYQGKVQGLSTAVAELEEMETLLKKTLDEKINSLYTTGEQLGINRTRMDELTNAALNGTYTIDMLNAGELTLHDRLVAVAAQQVKNTEATAKLEAAKRKLEKAELDLAIAEDVAAGNFEMAAARIEYAEAATLYTAEEAAAKRIQVYKQAGEEEAKYLLQDLTPEQKQKMLELNKLTEDELASFVEKWRDSSDSVKRAFLSGVDANTQSQFDQQLNQIDSIIREHQGFWSGVGDTLAEIFTFGIADTWTYNGNKKGVKVYRQGNTTTVSSMAVGTNYVPNDGLAYLHQGEAVIPKKYNRPYEPGTMSQEERAYMTQMLNTIRTLDNTMKQGITVNGQFTQRGSDLVAVVNRTRSQTGADLLSNVAYAR